MATSAQKKKKKVFLAGPLTWMKIHMLETFIIFWTPLIYSFCTHFGRRGRICLVCGESASKSGDFAEIQNLQPAAHTNEFSATQQNGRRCGDCEDLWEPPASATWRTAPPTNK